jgi:hypothetical protein
MTDLTGWVLVPVVATDEQLDCALRFLPNLPRVCMAVAVEDAIAASPSPPVDVAGLVGERDRLAEEHAWLSEKLRDSERDNKERIRHYTDNLKAEVRMWREQYDALMKAVAKGVALLPPAPISFDPTLRARAEAAEAEVARLREALQAVASLIDESDGVAGLHRNGDIAPWSELRTGGRFEEWLAPFDAALTHQEPTK